MKKNQWMTILFAVLPLIIGSIVGLIINMADTYQNYNLPSFAPPGIVFAIVWPILYLLIGISGAIIYNKLDNEKTLEIYKLNLVVNYIWPIIFTGFNLKLTAFFLLLILIFLTILMMKEFKKKSDLSFYLLIPYLLWLLFAAVLNLSIVILN